MTTWMVLRTSGFLVLGLLTIAVALGIAGPGIRNPRLRLTSIALHRTAAVTGTLLLLAHVTAAVLDSWVSVSLPAVFVPGLSLWEPLWIGLGALALDAILILALTSAMRRRYAVAWWNIHVISYVAYALAWLHAVGAGSDVSDPIMRWLAIGSAAAVAAGAAVRVLARGAPVGVGLQQDRTELVEVGR
jgi:sulfoxide reductase heme-binding subunit YedZ